MVAIDLWRAVTNCEGGGRLQNYKQLPRMRNDKAVEIYFLTTFFEGASMGAPGAESRCLGLPWLAKGREGSGLNQVAFGAQGPISFPVLLEVSFSGCIMKETFPASGTSFHPSSSI
jgi:hypothetical protein